MIDLGVASGISVRTPAPCANGPQLLGIRFDGCSPPPPSTVGHDVDELLVYWSGSGFDAADLTFVKGSVSMGQGMTTCEFGQIPEAERAYTNECIRYVDGRTAIPPNAYVVILLHAGATELDGLDDLCRRGAPVYVLRSECERPGNFLNAGTSIALDPTIDFGCGTGPEALSFDRNVSIVSGFPQWYVPTPAPQILTDIDCGGYPDFERPPFVTTRVTVGSFLYTPTTEECGTRFIQAYVGDPLPGCPTKASVLPLEIDVACPVATLETGERFVCQGDPIAPVPVAITGVGGRTSIEWSVDGIDQGPAVGTGDAALLDLGARTPEDYVVTLTRISAIGGSCEGSIAGPQHLYGYRPPGRRRTGTSPHRALCLGYPLQSHARG